jgi:hypothetical protein
MAKVQVYKFRELDEIDLFLSGGVVGGDVSSWGSAIAAGGAVLKDAPVLAGLTLIFTQPAAHTVTFVAGADTFGRLQFSELKAQIEAVMTTVVVRMLEGKLVIVESTPTNGVTITKSGTANKALGFDQTKADTVGKVYGSPYAAAPAVPPYFLMAYSTNDNMHVVYTFE